MKPEAAENILQGFSLLKSKPSQGCIELRPHHHPSELGLCPRPAALIHYCSPFQGCVNNHIIPKPAIPTLEPVSYRDQKQSQKILL